MASFNTIKEVSEVVTLLDAVGTTGAGNGFKLTHTFSAATWQKIVTGDPDTLTVKIQGSNDDTNWFDLDSTTSTSSELRSLTTTNKLPVKFIRANVTAITDALSPMATVTVTLVGSVD